MKELTDKIKGEIRTGWKVGVRRGDTMVVYDVIARDENEIIGKERWILYPKESGKLIEEVKKPPLQLSGLSPKELDEVKLAQTYFTTIALNDIVSCLSNADGNVYSREGVMDKFGTYE